MINEYLSPVQRVSSYLREACENMPIEQKLTREQLEKLIQQEEETIGYYNKELHDGCEFPFSFGIGMFLLDALNRQDFYKKQLMEFYK